MTAPGGLISVGKRIVASPDGGGRGSGGYAGTVQKVEHMEDGDIVTIRWDYEATGGATGVAVDLPLECILAVSPPLDRPYLIGEHVYAPWLGPITKHGLHFAATVVAVASGGVAQVAWDDGSQGHASVPLSHMWMALPPMAPPLSLDADHIVRLSAGSHNSSAAVSDVAHPPPQIVDLQKLSSAASMPMRQGVKRASNGAFLDIDLADLDGGNDGFRVLVDGASSYGVPLPGRSEMPPSIMHGGGGGGGGGSVLYNSGASSQHRSNMHNSTVPYGHSDAAAEDSLRSSNDPGSGGGGGRLSMARHRYRVSPGPQSPPLAPMNGTNHSMYINEEGHLGMATSMASNHHAISTAASEKDRPLGMLPSARMNGMHGALPLCLPLPMKGGAWAGSLREDLNSIFGSRNLIHQNGPGLLQPSGPPHRMMPSRISQGII